MAKRFPARRTRKGVLISGAYGMENAGDDAVLSAITAELRRLDRDMPITVLARKPATTARRFAVEAIHPFRVLRWLPRMARTRLFLSGGGSLLQDVTSRRSLFYYLFTLRAARRMGCAVQLYGCGIGPLTAPRDRERTARVLNECADIITLRDRESLELLDRIGVTKPTVLLAADPAVAPAGPGGERERAIGLALRDWPGFRERLPAFAAAARYAWERYKLAPVFLCLAPEDRLAAKAVTAALPDVPCTVALDPRRAARMSLILSMRLHGLIFALRDGIPAGGIGYDPKVDAFCREAGLPCLSLETADTESLTRLIDDALHLDGENLSTALAMLRRRERVNGHAAAELLTRDEG